jgi:hypothetical protein
VAFSPVARGAQAAALSIPSNALSGSPSAVALSGVGLAPGVAAPTVSTLAFGTVTVGQSSTQTVTVDNPGEVPLSVSAVTVSGGGAFAVISGQDTCSGQTVAPGSSCTIAVRFVPTSAAAVAAVLSIRVVSGSPGLVALTGSGLAVPGPARPPVPAPPRSPAPTPTAAALVPGSLRLSSPTLTSAAHGKAATVTLSFRLTAPGTVTVALERRVGGRWVKAGARTRSLSAGRHRELLTRRFAGHTLAAGHYRLLVSVLARGRRPVTAAESLTVRRREETPVAADRSLDHIEQSI